MPLTIPSTAWSRAASSKTMLAALPPSSSVSFLPVPARRRWISLPTSVEPVKAILSTSSLSTSAAPVRPAPVREGVVELVGPAGVVEEVRRGERQVDVARLLDRLASVERLEDGELARALLEDAGDAEEVLRALGAGERRPAVGEGGACGGDGATDVGRRGLADGRERLLVAGRDRLVRLRRLEPLAADEEAVTLADLE